MKKTKKIILFLTLLFLFGCQGTTDNNEENNGTSDFVTYVDKQSHLEVTINAKGKTDEEVGTGIGNLIKKVYPDYETILDSYLLEIKNIYKSNYDIFISNIAKIKPNIPQKYVDEIEAISKVICTTDDDIAGDNKFSKNELYLLNLSNDLINTVACSAFSVYGSKSESNTNITARNLDWFGGSQNQLAKLQAVIKTQYDNKTVTNIGYLGFMGCLTGFNDNKIYAAILNSTSGESFVVDDKNSMTFDIRYCLENFTTIKDMSDYLTSSERNYTIGHLVFLSDSQKSVVVENDISSQTNRKVREASSTLHDGALWSHQNAIGAVNSFMINGSKDNFTGDTANVPRWNTINTQLEAKGDTVSLSEVREIISYNENGSIYQGDLYWSAGAHCTQQSIIYIPSTNYLEVAFLPKTGSLPDTPIYKVIK